jgi:hypothetical protein
MTDELEIIWKKWSWLNRGKTQNIHGGTEEEHEHPQLR